LLRLDLAELLTRTPHRSIADASNILWRRPFLE
jgi:hypothetical protein